MVRDGVFLQLAALTGLIWLVYYLFVAGKRLFWRVVTLAAGLTLFVALFVISVANVVLWSPS